MEFSSATGAARRVVATATAAIALVAMAAGPALAADGGYISVTRRFDVTGDRDRLAIVATVTEAAAGSGLGVGVAFGKAGSTEGVSVAFTHGGGRVRGIKVEGYSPSYQAVNGVGCIYEYRLTCDRPGFDWVEGRAYKVSFIRGARNADGWLWTVRVKDLQTAKTTKLVSLRAPFDKLAAKSENNAASLYANVADCSDVTPVAGTVRKPSGQGSSVSWGTSEKYAECEGASAVAPVVKGRTRLAIR